MALASGELKRAVVLARFTWNNEKEAVLIVIGTEGMAGVVRLVVVRYVSVGFGRPGKFSLCAVRSGMEWQARLVDVWLGPVGWARRGLAGMAS